MCVAVRYIITVNCVQIGRTIHRREGVDQARRTVKWLLEKGEKLILWKRESSSCSWFEQAIAQGEI